MDKRVISSPQTWAQWLVIACAITVPSLALVVRGSANASYFALAAAGVAAFFVCGRGRNTCLPDDRNQWRYVMGLCVSMAAPCVAVLVTQVTRWDFAGQPLDAPSRFLLAGVTLWCLWRLPAPWRARLRHVQWGVSAGAIASAVTLWLTPMNSDMRHTPHFATAITFGDIGLTLGVCAWLSLGWRLTDSRWEIILKFVAGAAGLYTSLLSGTRGGWLALPILLVLFLLLSRASTYRKIWIGALVVATLATIYGTNQNVRIRIHEAAAEYAAAIHSHPDDAVSRTSVGLRLWFWRAGLAMFASHPLSGVGSQHINDIYQDRVRQGLMPAEAAQFGHLHNDYLQALASNGLIGLLARLLAYLAPLWLFVRAARSTDKSRSTAGLLGATVVVAFMVSGLTEAMFAITMNASFYAAMVVIFAILALPREDERQNAGHIMYCEANRATPLS